MAQQIKVQDGIVVYSTPDPLSTDIDFTVRGFVDVTKEITIGDNPLAPGLIRTPVGSGVDLIIRTDNDGSTFGNIKFEPTPSGSILLNNIAWPDGTIPPTPGMYLGVSALNTLQFYTLPVIPTGAITINTQSGTNYTVQLSDAYNTLIRMTSATPATVTIEDDGTINMPIGSEILISQSGTGSVTLTPGFGVTINSPASLIVGAQYGRITIIKVSANNWEIDGNLAP